MSAVSTCRAVLVLVAALIACGPRPRKAPVVPGGVAERGRQAIARFGCGSCHVIPGVRGARGLVGPPLESVGERVYIAGVLPNDPNNLVRWIMNPPAVDEKTAMPNLGVTDRDARDIAEYLYSLRAK